MRPVDKVSTAPHNDSGHNITIYDIVIIGAGAAGLAGALELAKSEELAKSGFKILILEKGEILLSSETSTSSSCRKLHLGFHYLGDISGETSRKCLKTSVDFGREFFDCLLGEVNAPSRRGCHFVLSNSLYNDWERIEKLGEDLKQEYQKLVDECESENRKVKEIFGPPSDFMKKLGNQETDFPHVAKEIPLVEGMEYKGSEKTANVRLAIETAESQIDLNAFRDKLSEQIKAHPNITLMFQQKVLNMSYTSGSLDYEILAANSRFRARNIVNCAWEAAEKLGSTLGMYVPDDSIVIRVKVIIVVELPLELHEMKTCIFSVGPFCSITNLLDGTAIVTEETVTNVGYFQPRGRLKGKLATLLNRRTPEEERSSDEELIRIGDDILDKSSQYVPGLRNCKIKERRIGFVKMLNTDGTISIRDKGSPIHTRTESGVRQLDLDYFENSAIKMTYAQTNAMELKKLFVSSLSKRKSLVKAVQRAYDEIEEESGEKLEKVLLEYLYIVARNVIARNTVVSLKKDTDEEIKSTESLDREMGEDLEVTTVLSPEKGTDEDCETIELWASEIKIIAKQRFFQVKQLNSEIGEIKKAADCEERDFKSHFFYNQGLFQSKRSESTGMGCGSHAELRVHY